LGLVARVSHGGQDASNGHHNHQFNQRETAVFARKRVAWLGKLDVFHGVDFVAVGVG